MDTDPPHPLVPSQAFAVAAWSVISLADCIRAGWPSRMISLVIPHRYTYINTFLSSRLSGGLHYVDMATFVINSYCGPVSLLNDMSDEPAQSLIPGIPRVQHGSSPSGPPKRECPVCSKRFSSTGHLTRHLTVHTGTKRFECPFPDCHKRCSRQDNLTQHYRMHLPGHLSKQSSCAVRQLLDDMRRVQQEDGHSATTDENESNGIMSVGCRTTQDSGDVPHLCDAPFITRGVRTVLQNSGAESGGTFAMRVPSGSPRSSTSRLPSTADNSLSV
ncbi:hypothetical protein CALVIDRAFT_423359 [Calocera viscosa TUFC12733]|uniref:C2H2-type domain-containing protein n=1 Tax=Calocera viscosa (strain TUFC12733) TaxID=1330018 RepID=A0A167PJT3_CALVF|nr:hypothetical protein CALVIDRAFT_423359 [Calocera viscosa TUFC12733]